MSIHLNAPNQIICSVEIKQAQLVEYCFMKNQAST